VRVDRPDAPKEAKFRAGRIAFWDSVSGRLPRRWTGLRSYYHELVVRQFRQIIPPGKRVLELGCGQGDLLAALEPSYGAGVDMSPRALEIARARYPALRFIEGDAHGIALNETFDYVVLSDLVNDLWDVQRALENAREFCTPETRIVVSSYTRLWSIPRGIAQWAGFAIPLPLQNWLTGADVQNLLYLSGFETFAVSTHILLPLRIPILAGLCNRYFARMYPFREFALTNFHVARLQPSPSAGPEPVVSVIVAARNEAGNIPAIFDRIPQMGSGTELIFVEGGSKDGTWDAIGREIEARPHLNVRRYRQPGKGKGDAVREGFRRATGGMLMILDADLTVAPEDLPRFYEAIRSGRAEFANGVRLVYPMEDEAMRFFNWVANRFFSAAFSWLLSQPVKDTLCGTKVLSRRNYEALAANRAYFGDFDPFGDFDLLFGAAKLNLRIVDIPVRYRERTYGETNIQRWSGGMVLLRMVLFAMRRIKFV